MRAIFFITCVIIVYGSLYPFNFSAAQLSDHGVSRLFNFDITKTRLSDLISNIVLFIPFGLFSCAAFNTIPRTRHHILFLFISFVFAFAIQALQLWAVGRIPWGGDAVLNTLGCIVGFGLFAVVKLDVFNYVRELPRVSQVSFTLACALIILTLSPFAPALDLQMLKDNIKALINAPTIDGYWLFEHTLFWLTSFFLLQVSKPEWARLKRLTVIVSLVLATKFLIVSNNINLSQLLAGIFALLIWGVFNHRLSAWLLGGLMLFAILCNGLYPFELRNVSISFNWLPFTGSISSNILLDILALINKLLFFGTTVWLLYLSLKNLKKATVLCASIVLISEFFQQYFIHSIPELTDVLLVLIISFVLSTLLKIQPVAAVAIGMQDREHGQHDNLSGTKTRVTRRLSIVKSFFNVVPMHHSLHYIHSLDGLRAIAALAVFMVHFQQFTGVGLSIGIFDFERLMINGNTGVALFFTLSGFLLSIPFWQHIQKGNAPKLRHYFVNRLVRIVPIYYLCIFALLVLQGFSGAEVNFNNILSHMLFAHNFKDYQVMSLNPPFWTLAVEFQFYLILPLFFLLFAKLGYKSSQLLTLLLIMVIYVVYRSMMYQFEMREEWPIRFGLIWPLGVHINSVDGMALKYSLLAHLPHFLIGVFIASLWRYKDKLAPLLADALFWFALVTSLIILSTVLDEYLQLDYARYNYPFIPILLAVIVFTAPLARSAKAFLELCMIKWLGIISYGIYVFHYPILKGIERLFAKTGLSATENTLLFAIAALGLTFLVAHVSYVMLERPVLEKFRSKNKVKTPEHVSMAAALAQSVSEQTVPVEQAQQAAVAMKLSPLAPKPQTMFTHKKSKSRKAIWLFLGATSGLAVVMLLLLTVPSSPSFKVEQVPWAFNSARPLTFDHHAHTKYSDGSKSIEQLTELAYFRGCDAFAITDHDQNTRNLSQQKMQEIRGMRQQYSNMFIFAGIELGMPSYDGREHVNILTTPDVESEVLFGVMQALQSSSNMQSTERDLHILNAIRSAHPDGAKHSVAIYNHPSRKDLNEAGDENLSDITKWNANYPIIIGMAGAPGHQKKQEIGSYETKFFTIDRWDPAVANVGGTWDQLLSDGVRFWGAIASSDYHNDSMDYAPCEFSRMHLTVPERSYLGIIEALKAGTFWADHGNLLDSFNFAVHLDDFLSVTLPGGTLKLSSYEQILSVNLEIERGPAYKEDFMRVDLISNCGKDEVVSSSSYLRPEQSRMESFLSLSPTQKSCFVRSRVVRETADDEDLSAYSNPIFIEIDR